MEKKYELTEDQITALATSAAAMAVASFAKDHACRFNDIEAKDFHAFSRACREHDAKDGDIMIMVYSAKTVNGMVKRALWGVIIVLGLLALYIFSGSFLTNPGAALKSFRGA